MLRSCTPSPALAAAAEPAAVVGAPASTSTSGLGEAGAVASVNGSVDTVNGQVASANGSAASVNGSAASDLVSAAAWEEGAAAAAGMAEEEALPLEGGSYTAFCQASPSPSPSPSSPNSNPSPTPTPKPNTACQATGNRLFAAREWGQAVAWYTIQPQP